MTPSRSLVAMLVLCLSLVLLAAPAAFAQDSGLVAAYGFEEPSGTSAVDSSGSANTGTLAGPTRSAAGRFGGALSFDGVNDRVNVNDSASLDLTTAMTLEAWVRPNSLNWRTVLLKERPGGLAYALYSSSDNNRPMAEIAAATGGETRGLASLASATWSHLATTYDGATLRLYVNGTQVSSRAMTGAMALSSGALRIGGNAVWGEYFGGLIDEVRVYKRALTAAEIQLDMGRAVVAPADSTPPTAPELTATVTSDDVHLSWTASTDDLGVKEYRLYRDGALIGTRTSREFDDDNRPVGTYRYKVVAVDDAGHTSPDSNEAEATVEPDTTPPSVSVGGICNGATVHDYVVLRPTYADDRGPVTVTIKVDGETVHGPRLLGTSGAFFWEWETGGLSNGPHVMSAFAVDGAGNETVSEPCDWTVHNPELTVPITTLSDGQTVSGTVVIKVEPRADGEPLPAGYPVTAVDLAFDAPGVTDGPGANEWTWDTTKAPNGEYTFQSFLYWMDYGVARATSTIHVTVDNSTPAPTGLTATVRSDDIDLAWNAVPGASEYHLYRDGTRVRTGIPHTWSTDLDRPVGTYRYSVVAVKDGSESERSDEVEATVEPDTTPPSVSVAATCNGATVADYISLRPTFSDDRGPVTITVKVDGETVYGPIDKGISGPFYFDWETRGLTNGPHVMTIFARDAAGNEAVSEPCDWNVHNPDVTIPITSHSDGEIINGTEKFTADVLGDGQPLNRSMLRVYWSITPAGGGTGTGGGDLTRPFEFEWQTGMAPDGLYNVKITATWLDYTGPLASNTIQVRLRNAPPAPTGVRTEVRDDDVDVMWDAVAGVSSYNVYRDGTKIGNTSGTGYTDRDRPAGTYRYTVKAQQFNAESDPSEEVTATVAPDTTPPTVALASGCDGATVSDYINLRPTFSDNRGPVTLTIKLDGETIRGPFPMGASGSYMFDWETHGLTNGPHVMTAVARDGAGNEAIDQCDWIVDNPTVTLPFTSHNDGDTVSGTVVIKAQPLGDGQPLSRSQMVVVFGATGPVNVYDQSSVFDKEWSWDTTKVPDGLYTVKASVSWMGYSRNFATNSIQLRVDNPDAPPPPSGLVAAYGFEHASGTTATDSSGKGSTGTIAGATSVAGGKFGRALSFDGSGDLVTVADSNPLDLAPGMTLSAWVKPTTVADWRTVLLKERPGSLSYALYAATDNGRPQTEIAVSGQREARGPAALPVGVWTHLAATYDGATVRLFVDGTQVASAAATGTLANSAGALRIGGNAVWGEWFSGLIDEVRVYERALGAAEIQADRDRAVVPGT